MNHPFCRATLESDLPWWPAQAKRRTATVQPGRGISGSAFPVCLLHPSKGDRLMPVHQKQLAKIVLSNPCCSCESRRLCAAELFSFPTNDRESSIIINPHVHQNDLFRITSDIKDEFLDHLYQLLGNWIVKTLWRRF